MYEISGPSVVAAKAMLRHHRYVEEYCNEVIQSKSMLQKSLNQRSIPVIPTSTNFIHIDFGINKKLILSNLSDLGFLLQGGIRMKSYESYSRISIGSTAVMEELLSAIEGML
jgi:histidinol-phosphate/aromatic aminotransferase/cobyric acid decarboxylase-like protein